MAPDAVREGKYRSQKEFARDLLTNLLKDGPMPANLVYQAAGEAGISERTIDRVKEELKIKSVQAVEGWNWILPVGLSLNWISLPSAVLSMVS